jgi:hypothetical protein
VLSILAAISKRRHVRLVAHSGPKSAPLFTLPFRSVAIGLAVVFLFASGADAQTRSARAPRTVRSDPLLGYSQRDPSVVSVGGAYVGRDPDPNIRAQLNRFPGSYVSGGF